MGKVLNVHGIDFVRYGACNQCGACGCDNLPCPHLTIRDGKFWCEIYDRREEICLECYPEDRISHVGCVRFPDNPWIAVIRNGACGFWFERVDGGSMDELPFLFGEPYRRE